MTEHLFDDPAELMAEEAFAKLAEDKPDRRFGPRNPAQRERIRELVRQGYVVRAGPNGLTIFKPFDAPLPEWRGYAKDDNFSAD